MDGHRLTSIGNLNVPMRLNKVVNRATRLCLALLLGLLSAFALGQPNTPPTASLSLPSAKAGEQVIGTVTLKFAEGLHAYQNPPTESYMIPVSVKSSSSDVSVLGVKYPKGVDAIVGGSTTPVKVYEGTVEIPVTLKAPAKAGSYDVALKIQYQQCNANNCYPPSTVTATAKLIVTGATTPSVPAGGGTKPDDGKKPQPAKPDTTKTGTPIKLPTSGSTKSPPPQKETGGSAQTSGDSQGASQSGEAPSKGNDQAPAVSNPSAGETTDEGFIATNLRNAFQSGNYFFVVILALLTGLALAVTPCVYPMIPITVGFFSNQAAGNRSARVGLGLMYMLGLALTYGVVGGVSAALGGTIGSLFQAPWFLIALGLLMAALALSMFDVYEIRLPAFLGKQIHGRSGAVGALIMGLLMGFAAAPCAGPVVTAFAIKVAEFKNLPLGLLLFTSIGVGLGLPFFILGAVSSGAKTLPRSGGWLKTLKALLGIVVLWVALNYLLQGFQFKSTEPRTMLIDAVFLVLAAGYLFLFEKSGNTQLIWGIKGAAILLCGVFAGQLISSRSTAIRDEQLAALGSSTVVRWEPFTLAAFDAAKKSGKPIVIDASADWCAICHEIENDVFNKPEGIAAMQNVVALRIDQSTGVDPKYVAMTNQLFGIKGLPHVEILKPGGDRVKVITGKDELDTPEQLKIYLAQAK